MNNIESIRIMIALGGQKVMPLETLRIKFNAQFKSNIPSNTFGRYVKNTDYLVRKIRFDGKVTRCVFDAAQL